MISKLKSYRKLGLLLGCAVFAVLCLSVLFPISVNAWEIETTCDFCGEFIADDWICPDGNHCGPESERGNCYEEHHCKECGVCEDQATWCSECNMCLDCALE